jgi:RNA polymerase sigma-70 factor (ECF subfamily)
MSESAIELYHKAVSGDLDAASELVGQHYERIFAWFRRLCGQDADAADLTQKTFSKVWSSLGSFQGRSSFSTWLHGIGYHVYLDWRRQRRTDEPLCHEWWLNCADAGPSPFDSAADREKAEQVWNGVERLEENSREIIHLHYYQGLSIAETAEVLGIATSTVKYRLREALEALKSRLTRTSTHLPSGLAQL